MFIVVEGLEGAGKSSALDTIRQVLIQAGVPSEMIKNTREPGGTPIAEKIREIAKMEFEDESLTDESELMLMYASRNQLVSGVIKPWLKDGFVVVGDRHDWSTSAYQGGGRGISDDVIDSLRRIAIGDFQADLYIFMDVEPEVGLARARGRGELDRIEKMNIEFFDNARKKFCELAKLNAEKTIVINANNPISVVEADLREKLLKFFKVSGSLASFAKK